MYEAFYGLRTLPFELTASPRYLYLTAAHREALSSLQYGLSAAKSVTVLIGEAGTGKTTLLNAACESDRCRHVNAIRLSNPALTRAEFIQSLARRLGLSAEAAASKTMLLEELENAVGERRSRGEVTALVVDEAQSLSAELLEEIRLLANIETDAEKLLPLVLVGQPSLGVRLDHPDMRQFKQRVALRCELLPLTLAETAAYIAKRIEHAGGRATRLFTRDAVIHVHEYSGGIPRTISVICDNTLLLGLASGRQPVGPDLVDEACRDLALRRQRGERLDLAATPPQQEAESARREPPAGEAGPRLVLSALKRWGRRAG